jgi:hypothetical protein
LTQLISPEFLQECFEMKKCLILLTALVCCGLAPIQAALIVDLRFSDGSKTKPAVAGNYSIDVWAQVTGANTTPDEGLVALYGAVRSTQVNGGAIASGTSGITANVASNANWTVTPAFGQTGTPQNATTDGIQDWGTLATNSTATIKYNTNLAGGTTPVFLNTSGQAGAVNALANGVEFKVGTLTFTLNGADVNAGAALNGVTNIDWVLPTGTFPNRHSHLIDGNSAAVTTAATYLASGPTNGVSFTANAIPEPGTLALGGILLAGLAGWSVRRKRQAA